MLQHPPTTNEPNSSVASIGSPAKATGLADASNELDVRLDEARTADAAWRKAEASRLTKRYRRLEGWGSWIERALVGLSSVVVVLAVFNLFWKLARGFGANSVGRPVDDSILNIINGCNVAMLAGFVVTLALSRLRTRLQKAAELYEPATEEEAE